MFSNLRKKIQKDDNSPSALPSIPEQGTNLVRSSSIESLESAGQSETRSRKRDDLVKKMESKLSEMAILLREKNERIEELTRLCQTEREDAEKLLLRLKEANTSSLNSILDDHRRELEKHIQNNCLSSTQEKDWCTNRLKQLDETIAAYKEKFHRREEESAEVTDFSRQEIAKLKHMLMNTENQLQHSQRNLFSCQGDLETLKQQLDQVKRERDLKHQWNESLQAERDQLDQLNRQNTLTIRNLTAEIENYKEKANEAEFQLQKYTSLANSAERVISEAQDRYQSLNKEYENLKIKFTYQQETFADKKTNLEERIKVLERRLTEWESTDYSSTLNTEKQSENEDDVENQRLSQRLASLTKERNELEQSLIDLQNQHNSGKLQWMERGKALETQIANLTMKMCEDAEERKDEQMTFHQNLQTLQNQVQKLKENLSDREDRLAKMEILATDYEREWKRCKSRCEQLEDEQNSYIDSLRDQVSQLTAEKTVDKKSQDELQLTVDSLNLSVSDLTHRLNKVNKDLLVAQNELSHKTQLLNQLEKERFEQNLKCSELKSQISSLDNEMKQIKGMNSSMKEEANELKLELKTCQDNRSVLELKIVALENNLSSTQKDTHERIQRLQDEIKAKIDEVDVLRSKNATLKENVDQLESERETVFVKYESREVSRLKEEIADMQMQLSDKNKTIKIQKQRLLDLKKTLERELRVRTLSGNLPPALSMTKESTNPIINGDGHNSRSMPMEESGQNGTKSIESTPTPPSQDLNSSIEVLDNKGRVIMDTINFRYLRHVVVKFLLCKESEAVHLIRALVTLLKLSNEEEELLRQTLEYRRSWFASRPSLLHAPTSSFSNSHLSSTSTSSSIGDERHSSTTSNKRIGY